MIFPKWYGFCISDHECYSCPKNLLAQYHSFKKKDMFKEFRCFNCQLPLWRLYFDVKSCWTESLVLEIIFHHHFNVKAILRYGISSTLNPPSSLAQHTCPQEARLYFPFSAEAPYQKNLLCMWSIFSLTHCGNIRDEVYVDKRTELSNTTLSAMDNSFSFQHSNFLYSRWIAGSIHVSEVFLIWPVFQSMLWERHPPYIHISLW